MKCSSQMNTTFFLECCAVSKFFGKNSSVQALADISFEIRQGEQLCITGASGSGKTTLLNIIGGLQPPSGGDIKVEGRSLFQLTQRQLARLRARDFGLIFQSPALIPVLSARENVEYALYLAKPDLHREQRVKLVAEALEITNLQACQHLRPGELSGGESQRTAIARAVVKHPKLVLADEPTSHLDDQNTEIILEVFRRLQSYQRCTIVVATHDARILSFGSRTLSLRSGRSGDPIMPRAFFAGAMYR